MNARVLAGGGVLAASLALGACHGQPQPLATMALADPGSWPILEVPAASASWGLTMYADGWTMAQDVRSLALEAGNWAVRFLGVPSSAEAAGAVLEVPWRTVDRRFLNDLASRDQLLARYDGQEVEIWPKGATEPLHARLRWSDGGALYQVGDRLYPDPPGKVALPALSGLTTTPTLEWRGVLSFPWAGAATASYVVERLGWACEYTLITDADQARASWSQWAQLTNHSGASFQGARVRLGVGDVRRGGRPHGARGYVAAPEATTADAGFAPRSFAGRYLLDLPEPISLRDREERRLALASRDSVLLQRIFRFERGVGPYPEGIDDLPTKARLVLELANTPEAGLGMPLPRGKVTVYTPGQGGLAIAGVVPMPDTPRSQPIILDLGEAFDLTMRRTQTSYQLEDQATVVSYRLMVANQLASAATVEVRENVSGDWSLVEAVPAVTAREASRLRWMLVVPALGEAEVRYTLRIRRERPNVAPAAGPR